jgi:endoglycosylceramidase
MGVMRAVVHLAVALALIGLLLPILIMQNAEAAENIISNQGFLRTEGVQILDAKGKVALLRGVNYPGYDECSFRDGYPALHSQATYSRFASLGFNVVRLPISWAMLEPKAGIFDLSYLANYINKDVQWAKLYGLYIVLDMHQYYWAKEFGGCGVPSWALQQYTSSKASMVQFVSNFWINDTLQNHVADVWTKIARIYANESIVAGYDVLNEPFVYTSVIPYLNATNVNRFYSQVIASIRSVDSSHIIFLEPANMYSNVEFGKNIVWSPHFYLFAFNSTYSSQAAGLLEQDIAGKYQTFVTQSGTPMWIGEFGAFMRDGTYVDYLHDVQTIFERYQIGWAWWGFNSEFGQRIPSTLASPTLTTTVPTASAMSNKTS